MSVVQYTLNDYNELFISSGTTTQYILNKHTLEIIDKLNESLGITNTKPSSISNAGSTFSSKKQKYGNHHHNHHHVSRCDTDSWHMPQNEFKATVLDKKEGTTFGDIKAFLNKMSAKTYTMNRDAILAIIQSNSDSEHALYSIANYIFEIASTNKFYSEMYATLYAELIQEYGVFKDILLKYIDTYSETFQTIKYVDQSKNYDEFCLYNKKNDMRKATTLFIVNLTIKGVLSKETLIELFDKIMKLVLDVVEKEGVVNEVDEMTENIALIVVGNVGAKHIFADTPQMDLIKMVAGWKSKDKKSLSSRAVFKFMDMLAAMTLKK